MSLASPESALEQTALGDYIAQREETLYAQEVSDVFGYHALQIGAYQSDLLSHSRIPNKYYLTPEINAERTNLLCESEFLPLAENAVDLVCLPHVMEQCLQPQQTLREVYRVLVADGSLILTGISPFSLLGLRIRVGRVQHTGQTKRLFTARRMRDWLSVLGFEVTHVGHIAHALPINDARWLGRQQCLERWGARSGGFTGGIYYIVAKKRVLNMRLIKPEWKKMALSGRINATKTHSRMQKQSPLPQQGEHQHS